MIKVSEKLFLNLEELFRKDCKDDSTADAICSILEKGGSIGYEEVDKMSGQEFLDVYLLGYVLENGLNGGLK